MSLHKRLTKLEEEAHPLDKTFITQVLICDPVTGIPLPPVNDRATKFILIVDDGRGLNRNER